MDPTLAKGPGYLSQRQLWLAELCCNSNCGGTHADCSYYTYCYKEYPLNQLVLLQVVSIILLNMNSIPTPSQYAAKIHLKERRKREQWVAGA